VVLWQYFLQMQAQTLHLRFSWARWYSLVSVPVSAPASEEEAMEVSVIFRRIYTRLKQI
jgi:hypothetical protein